MPPSNRVEAMSACVAHAEILALAEAGQATGSYTLDGHDAVLVSSTEPCAMCLGAVGVVRSRAPRVRRHATDGSARAHRASTRATSRRTGSGCARRSRHRGGHRAPARAASGRRWSATVAASAASSTTPMRTADGCYACVTKPSEELDDLRLVHGVGRARLGQDLGGHALGVVEQRQQQVLRADVVVAHRERLAQRAAEHLGGPRRVRRSRRRRRSPPRGDVRQHLLGDRWPS